MKNTQKASERAMHAPFRPRARRLPRAGARVAPRGPVSAPVFLVGMAALLACSCAAGAVVGSSSVGLSDLMALASGAPLEDGARNILLNVRLPRVLAAALAGCALATAGAIIQAVLNNPLASPNVIGVNSGAGFAVLLVSSVFPAAFAFLPVAAFGGALAAVIIVFAIAARSGSSKLVVVLAGMGMTAVFGAGMNVILVIDPDAYVGSSGFLVGSLSGVRAEELAWPAAYIAAGLFAALCLARPLTVLSLGDDTAHSLGMNVGLVRMLALAAAAVLAGAAVSFAGLLGFVGLMVPHIARFFVGHGQKAVIPASALMGAAFVVLCDLLARVAFAPYEIAVGIVMAFLGGPFFIFLILRKRGADEV